MQAQNAKVRKILLPNFDVLNKAWLMLDRKERRRAWRVLILMIMAALSSAAMVGSIMPFLSVLTDPKKIQNVPLFRKIYDMGGFASDYEFLVVLGLGSLLVIVTSTVLQLWRVWKVNDFIIMQIYTLSRRLLSNYLSQPYEYFLSRHSGDMSTRILSETTEVVEKFFRPFAEIVAATFSVVLITGLLFWVNYQVTLIILIVLGTFLGGMFVFTRKTLSALGTARAKANKLRFRVVGEALTGVKDVKLLGVERNFISRFSKPTRIIARSTVTANLVGQLPGYILQALTFGGLIALSLFFLHPNELSAGAALSGLLPLIGVFAFAGQRLLPEFNRIYFSISSLRYGAEAVSILYSELVEFQGNPLSFSDRTEIDALGLHKSLCLCNVRYQYPNSNSPSLIIDNLTINAGEKIGVIGATGSGKTTFADLILGLLVPTSGYLKADGITVSTENLPAWQKTVGYVPQDIFLTDASVAKNIAFGTDLVDIDIASVKTAARIACIHDFIIENLPQSYDTKLGDRGVLLSGGQRQRIGIARALYYEADLVVFDEATSALDNSTESEVISAIDSLPGDKTIVMIAHRLTTVRNCDKIIFLEAGLVNAFDTWENLFAENEAFRLFVSQK